MTFVADDGRVRSMSNMSLVATAAEIHSEPAVSPYLIGAVTLLVLLALLVGLLMFGKGREHS